MSLEIKNLYAAYGADLVFTDLSVPALERGQLIALVGPNGCGKSTLIKLLAGVLKAQSGQALWHGEDLLQLSPQQRSRRVTYMPQGVPQGVHLHVLEALIVAARTNRSISAALAQELSLEVLEDLEISHLAMRYMDQMSGGQRQSVALAQTLVRTSPIMLLDEPTSALDLRRQQIVMQALKAQAEHAQAVVIVALHDLNLALHHSDQCILMHAGQIYAQGAPAEVLNVQALMDVYGVQAELEIGQEGRAYLYY